jgi:hypothetical protein
VCAKHAPPKPTMFLTGCSLSAAFSSQTVMRDRRALFHSTSDGLLEKTIRNRGPNVSRPLPRAPIEAPALRSDA